MPHGDGSPTGQSARPCRLAQPRMYRDACSQSYSTRESAARLRLGKKSTRQLQDFVGPAQFLVLALQLLDTLRLCGSNAVAHAGIDLHALDPFIERLRYAANLWGGGFNGRPQRGVTALVLLHHAHCAFSISGENLFDFFMAQSSQRFEPPQNTGQYSEKP